MAQQHATGPEWVHLGEQDEVIWQSRPHLTALGRGVPAGVGIIIVGVLVAWFVGPAVGESAWILGGLIALTGLILAVGQTLVWANTRYVVTTTELYAKRGIVSREVSQLRIDRVQNTHLEQSVIGRIFDYGTLSVYTAGSGSPELTFDRVPQPRRAVAVISERLPQ